MLYYILIISAPVDICRTYMLQHNKRIYAMMLCTGGGLKYFIDAIIFD